MLKKKNTEEIKRIAELEENKERDDKIIYLQDLVIRLQEDLLKQKNELLGYREEKIKQIKQRRVKNGKEIHKKANRDGTRKSIN